LQYTLPPYCLVVLFFLPVTATPEIYTLSLHDALPICHPRGRRPQGEDPRGQGRGLLVRGAGPRSHRLRRGRRARDRPRPRAADRSEEHTSELQSRRDLVCRLLLEKKKPIDKVATGYQK